ncbi:hypothetical protein V1477_021037 [Vespula maculifrons]|uniref:Uncharacterized protein n=1 Tax=Vespula maculifrons TaxID=7453 RepID=A0ABD2AJ79_VESMC
MIKSACTMKRFIDFRYSVSAETPLNYSLNIQRTFKSSCRPYIVSLNSYPTMKRYRDEYEKKKRGNVWINVPNCSSDYSRHKYSDVSSISKYCLFRNTIQLTDELFS